NSLEGDEDGINQLECTINGTDERANKATMEKSVKEMRLRLDYYEAVTNNDTTQIYRAFCMTKAITEYPVAPTKPIIGANAFAHESGIHQHGVLANKQTYEIMTPESVGIPQNAIVLGKHSGRHAFEDRLRTLGYHLDAEKLDKAFA